MGTDSTLDCFISLMCDHDLLSAEEERSLSQVVQSGLVAQQELASGMDSAHLSATIKAGLEARNRFIESNQRLVFDIAWKAVHSRVDILDLVQEGNIALMRAIDKYNGYKGFRFSTYATVWVRAYVAIHASEDRTCVRVPHKIYSTREKVRAARDRLMQHTNGGIGLSEVAVESGMSIEHVKRSQELLRVVSLDQELTYDTTTALVDMIEDARSVDPSEHALKADEKQRLWAAIRSLPQLERTVISLRHGIVDSRSYTKREVADLVGVSVQEVSKAEMAAMSALRNAYEVRSYVSDRDR